MAEKISFIFYYVWLRLKVGGGLHKTPNPLNMARRWHYRREKRINQGEKIRRRL